jgi:hypothetical protein
MAEGAGVLSINAKAHDLMRMQGWVNGLDKQQRQTEEDKQETAPPAYPVDRSEHSRLLRWQVTARSYRVFHLRALQVPSAAHATHASREWPYHG